MSGSQGEGYLITMIGSSSARTSLDQPFESRLSPASQQLLSLLVAAGAEGLSTDRLADELWGEDLPSTWRASLRMALSRLRRQLPEGAIVVGGGTVQLSLAPVRVDVWHLVALASQATTLGQLEGLDHVLGSPQIYPGVEVSPVIEQSLVRLAAAQRTLISALVESSEHPLPRSLLASLEVHSTSDPLDVQLARVVAKAHADAGLLPQAMRILQSSLDVQMESFGLEADHNSVEMLREFRMTETDASQPRLRPRVPSTLEALGERPAVGRLGNQSQLESLTRIQQGQHRVVVVEGESGSGKSSLLAHAARLLVEAGVEVVYVPAVPGGAGAYSSFVAALPEVATTVAAVLGDREASPGAKRAAVWNEVLRVLSARAGGRSIAVMIDDCQWLDSQERELVGFLIRSQFPAGSIVFAAGRAGLSSSWTELKATLTSLPHVEMVAMERFDEDTMHAFVSVHRPELSPDARSEFAQRLFAASGGLPAVARALVGSGDGSELLGAVGSDEVARVRMRVETELDASQLNLLAACSVKGTAFTVADAATLTGQTAEDALEALDRLLDLGLLRDSKAPGEFRFEHALYAEAFRSVLSRSQERQLHLVSAASTSNPHQRAHHLVSALPSGDARVAAEALFESARQHAAGGAHREAVQALETLQQRCQVDLTTRQRVAYAASLSRLGDFEQAVSHRILAFEAAMTEADWEAAIDAVEAGLPEAERAGQEADRVHLAAVLLDVPGLPRGIRWRANLLLTRQASLAGQHELAFRALAELAEAARTSADEAALQLSIRHVRTFDRPEERAAALESVDTIHLSGDDRFLLELYRAIDLLESGDVHEARAAHRQLRARATTMQDPYRAWQALLFESVFAFTVGEWDDHRQLIERAFDHASRFGIAAGPLARQAQYVAAGWVTGLLELLPPLGPMSDDAMTLEKCGRALVAEARADLSVADRLADDVMKDLDGNPDPQWVSCAAMLAPIVARRDSQVDRSFLTGILAPRAGSAVIIGAGLANLGPVDRYLALLATSTKERKSGFIKSAELAKRWQMPVWVELNARDASVL